MIKHYFYELESLLKGVIRMHRNDEFMTRNFENLLFLWRSHLKATSSKYFTHKLYSCCKLRENKGPDI